VFADRIAVWLSRHWLALINVVLAAYVGLPVLAPVLMESGHLSAARIIYAIYAPMCHQLPHRSYFLYGTKATYTMDEIYQVWPEADYWKLRQFTGNPTYGYKVALCERDIAIWGSLFFCGLMFSLVRSRARPISFWVYVLVGVVPMMLDGGSQWLSYLAVAVFPQLDIVPRESTWLLRTITGGLFGWATAWLAFPHLQAAFAEMAESSQMRLEQFQHH